MRADAHHLNLRQGVRDGSEGFDALSRRTYLSLQVGDIWYTTDGQCYDEMNRNLWLVLLNAIMQTVDGSWQLPGGSTSGVDSLIGVDSLSSDSDELSSSDDQDMAPAIEELF